jgi:hypothetical protein
MVKFESVSPRCDANVAAYHFDGVADDALIEYLISRVALEDMAGNPVNPDAPLALFADQREHIFRLARQKFRWTPGGCPKRLVILSDDIGRFEGN